MNELVDMPLYRPSRKSDEAVVPLKQANKALSGGGARGGKGLDQEEHE